MAKATFDNTGFPTGSFSKANTQNQFDSLHQGDIASLRPRAQSSPNMTIAVAAATIESFFRQVYYNNAQSTYAGGNTSTMTAPTSNPRIDLVYLNSGGTLSITTGSEAASPSAPTYPDLATSVPICEIYHRVGETSIVNYEDKDSNPTEGYIYRDVRPLVTLGGVSDHGGLGGLTDDDHSQYTLLAGRSGGQTIKGGTAASENLVVQSTSHATRGKVNVKDPVLLDDQGGAPSASGVFQRHGANLKFHDGTASRTLSHDNTTVAGDVTGTIGSTTVESVQGIDVESGTPTNGDVLTYNSTNSRWQHEAQTQAWVFFETVSLSSTSTASSSLGTDWENLMLVLENVTCTPVDVAGLQLNSTTSGYATIKMDTTDGSVSKETSQANFYLGAIQSGVKLNGVVYLQRVGGNKSSMRASVHHTGDNYVVGQYGYTTAVTITSLTFKTRSGSTHSGYVHIYKSAN